MAQGDTSNVREPMLRISCRTETAADSGSRRTSTVLRSPVGASVAPAKRKAGPPASGIGARVSPVESGTLHSGDSGAHHNRCPPSSSNFP